MKPAETCLPAKPATAFWRTINVIHGRAFAKKVAIVLIALSCVIFTAGAGEHSSGSYEIKKDNAIKTIATFFAKKVTVLEVKVAETAKRSISSDDVSRTSNTVHVTQNQDIKNLFRRSAKDENIYETMLETSISALAALLAGFFAIFAIVAETSKFPRPLFRRLVRDKKFYCSIMIIGFTLVFNLFAMTLKSCLYVSLLGVFLFALSLLMLAYLGWVLLSYLGRRDIIEDLAEELSAKADITDE